LREKYKIWLMITDVDVKKLKKVFATKDDLKRFATKEDLNCLRDDLTTDIGMLANKIDENYSKVFDIVDGLASEIKDGRESREIFSYRIEDMDERVGVLERKACVV
jgi:hypothetical protein